MKKRKIEELKLLRALKQRQLKDKQNQLEQNEIFTSFINSVVKDKCNIDGFDDTKDLKDTFTGLNEEFKKLKQKKIQVDQEM